MEVKFGIIDFEILSGLNSERKLILQYYPSMFMQMLNLSHYTRVHIHCYDIQHFKFTYTTQIYETALLLCTYYNILA